MDAPKGEKASKPRTTRKKKTTRKATSEPAAEKKPSTRKSSESSKASEEAKAEVKRSEPKSPQPARDSKSEFRPAKRPDSQASQDEQGQRKDSEQREGGGSRSRRGRNRQDWRKSGKRRGKGKDRRPEGESNDKPQQNQQKQQKQQGTRTETPRENAPKRNRQRGGGGGGGGGEQREKKPVQLGSGMLLALHGGFGVLTSEENSYIASKNDIFVPQRLMQKYKLREGSIVEGHIGKGQKHKFQLNDVVLVDGKDPKEWINAPVFKDLTTVDPDFHYAVGEVTGETSMRIVDIVCPIGRGQRGLIVAPPRAGKTTIMREFAKGIEEGYPEVNLFVLLVDERPEEATEWIRSTKGKVFVSTSDEMAKKHIALAEAVWKRCTRLVEMGEDVVLILDSITRLARAYNNVGSGSGRTMSGGLDARAMERPRQIFGSARNTETAGSLTILGTALIETGSRMDTLIFEEFKGTGNMELVLSRKLADRRIFPAIDIERSGTRKEEKLVGKRRLKQIHTLRRVLARMSFIEAMELLESKLSEVEHNDDFLKRFEVDPDA